VRTAVILQLQRFVQVQKEEQYSTPNKRHSRVPTHHCTKLPQHAESLLVTASEAIPCTTNPAERGMPSSPVKTRRLAAEGDASTRAQACRVSFRGIPAGIPRFWGYRAGSVAKPVGIPLPNRTCYPIGIPVGLTGTGPVFSVKKTNRLDARSRASASRKPATNQHNTAALSRSRSRSPRPGAAREPSHSIPSLRRHARDPHKFPPPTALSPLPEFIASPSLWPVASYCG
jgi:hypothetical protein